MQQKLTVDDMRRKLKELRKEHEEYIREKREEALQAQELVKEYVTKRVREEESKNGKPFASGLSMMHDTELILVSRSRYRRSDLRSIGISRGES